MVKNNNHQQYDKLDSGVPQPAKAQPATPWGNHTPAHPADYKTWGEPDEEPTNGSEGKFLSVERC